MLHKAPLNDDPESGGSGGLHAPEVYYPGQAARWMVVITSTSLIGFGLLLLWKLFDDPVAGIQTSTDGFKAFPTLIFVPFALFLGGILVVAPVIGLIDLVRSKLVIGAERFILWSLAGKRVLLFSEVEGYRQRGRGDIFLYPVDPSKALLIVSGSFGGFRDIQRFVERTFELLPAKQRNDGHLEVLSNPWFPATTMSVRQFVRRWKVATWCLNIFTVVVCLWLCFTPYAVEAALCSVLLVPWVALSFNRFSGGLVLILSDYFADDWMPQCFLAYVAPPFALVLTALARFSFVDYDQLLAPAYVAAVIFVVLQYVARSPRRCVKRPTRPIRAVFSLFTALMLSAGYSFGGVGLFNCVFDRSKPEAFRVSITDKVEWEGDDGPVYRVKLEAWATFKSGHSHHVTSSQYRTLRIGDHVPARIYPGFLGIPWYNLGFK